MEHKVRIRTEALRASMNVLGAFHPTSGEARGVPTRFHRVDDTIYFDVASPTTNRAAVRHEVEALGSVRFTGVSRAVMVPHPPLSALIEKAPGEHVTLSWDDETKLPQSTGVSLRSDEFVAELKEVEADLNVSVEAVRAWSAAAHACASVTLPAERLAAILGVHTFAAVLPGSGGMSGVKFYRDRERFGAVATNSFAMAYASTPYEDGDDGGSWHTADVPPLIVVRHDVGVLRARVAALPADMPVHLWHTRSHLALACDAWYIEVRALDPGASFPMWQPILHKMATDPYHDDLTLDADAVAVVVKRVAALARTQFGPVGNPAVRLHLGEFATGLGVSIPVSLAEGAAEVHDQLPVAAIADIARDGDTGAGAAYNGGYLAAAAERLFRGQQVRALTRDGGPLYLSATMPTHATEFVLAPVTVQPR